LDPKIAKEIGGLDHDVSEPDSMIQFLHLSTMIARVKTKHHDPIVDFSKSTISILNLYEQVA
jgi:hypothetical protein